MATPRVVHCATINSAGRQRSAARIACKHAFSTAVDELNDIISDAATSVPPAHLQEACMMAVLLQMQRAWQQSSKIYSCSSMQSRSLTACCAIAAAARGRVLLFTACCAIVAAAVGLILLIACCITAAAAAVAARLLAAAAAVGLVLSTGCRYAAAAVIGHCTCKCQQDRP